MSERKLFYLKKYNNFYDDDRLNALLVGSTREELDKWHMKIYLYERMLHLVVKSGKEDGYLRFNYKTPYSSKLLAQVLKLDPEFVEKTIKEFEEVGLIEFANDTSGTIILPDFPYMVASTTQKAKEQSDRRAEARMQRSLPPGYEDDLKDG
ncbi:MAG: phage replisome organizer N-terminal domain-containing protein [Erysipelotrichales bacterium]|nr:phage replisome organizer N-terminal domain-containing protein [Erysipelotrichales bacterium]